MSPLSPKGTGVLTETTGAAHARILGVGGYRPERVVPNSEVIDKIDSSDEWIRERSGIISRRFAAPDETVVDMSEHATREALAMAGLEAGQIDAVIVATVTHPYQTPGAAPILADRLGIQGAAFDISAACAGYCHGIALANDMVRGGSAQHVLVVGVEKLSDFTDPYDRGTAFIFGDGAGAAIVGPSDTPAIGPTVWGSDGSQWKTISQRDSWIETREKKIDFPAITMAGQSVFRWAVWGMAPVAMIKQLKLPEDIAVARDIAETANTSAASIPLATERMLREGEAPHGGLALQIGFGAGLVYAAQVVVLP